MFPVSVVVLTFFVCVLLYLFAFGSQLSAHNIARKESGESEVNEMIHPSMLWKTEQHGELMEAGGRKFAA